MPARNLIAVLLVCGLLGCAHQAFHSAGGTDEDQESSSGAGGVRQISLSREETEFLKQAIAAGRTGIRLGQLAVKRGANSSLETFGRRLVIDHSQTNYELTEFARQARIAPPQIGPADQEMLQRIGKLPEEDFRPALLANLVRVTRQAIEVYAAASEQSRNSDLKAFVEQTLLMLEDQLRDAKRLASSTHTRRLVTPPEVNPG